MQMSWPLESASDNVLPRDGVARLMPDAVHEPMATDWFDHLVLSVQWQAHEVFMFGRLVPQPRLVAWYCDDGRPYRYSGTELQAQPWIPLLSEIRAWCELACDAPFNSVLVNRYRSGRDHLSWHADDEAVFGVDPTIASLSLGATRRFDLRHRTTDERVSVHLGHGSLLVMSGPAQHHWQHRIAPTARSVGERINLTFRYLHG